MTKIITLILPLILQSCLLAQDTVHLYIGNSDGSPLHVPYRGFANIPIWIACPSLSDGIINLCTSNEYISERLGGDYYLEGPYQFSEPEYREFDACQSLSFGPLYGEDSLVCLGDFIVRMNADSSHIGDLVDALQVRQAYFRDNDGHWLYSNDIHISQLAIDDITSIEETGTKPDAFILHPAYPNPFNSSTTIRFSTAGDNDIKLTIFDITGRRVRSIEMSNLPIGENSIIWDGTDDNNIPLSSGIYLFRLELGGRWQIEHVTLLK